MQKIITLIICLTITITANTQDSLTYALGNIAVIPDGKEVSLNETVPDIRLDKIVNYPKPAAPLNEFLDKPCILIFWQQFCPVCRKEMQTLEAMKKELDNKVNLLLVTFQSRSSVMDFIAEQKKAGRNFSYPTVIEDTLLRKTFPHDGDPHLVWINTKGVVGAITDHLAFTVNNIQQWVTTGILVLPYKHIQQNFDYNKPLLVNNNGGEAGAFQYRSVITGFIDSIRATSLIIKRTGSFTKIFMANATIDQMFKQLFFQMDSAAGFLDPDWMDKRVIADYKNPSAARNFNKAYEQGGIAFNDFRRKHLYTYELILPRSYTEQDALQCMLQDLQRYFHIHATIEKKEINGLALKWKGEKKVETTNSGKKEIFKTAGDSLLVMKNNQLWSLVNTLNLNFDLPFVVDETGYTGLINTTLHFFNRDRTSVIKDLHALDFDLEDKNYTIDMLVLSDLN
ncbi:hypothetical protein BH10BAC2_BH10BAC2_18050 [soil metagenome]